MKQDDDGLPTAEGSSKGLGVRTALHTHQAGDKEIIDIRYDDQGNVQPNTGGMSVSQYWKQMLPHLVPARLKCPEVPGAGKR